MTNRFQYEFTCEYTTKRRDISSRFQDPGTKRGGGHPGRLFPIAVWLTVVGVLSLSVAGCLARPKMLERTEFVMDTVVTIKAFGASDDILDRAFGSIRQLDRKLNRYSEESEIAKLNRLAGREPKNVSDETMKCLLEAVRVSELSNGAFDPTLGPLIDLWGIGKKDEFIPSSVQIETALALRGISNLALDRAAHTAYLRLPKMAVDLGAIAKGFAVEGAADVLKREGVRSAVIDAGGDIYVLGKKPDGEEWTIGVRHPRRAGRMIALVQVSDSSVVTSGDYERYFDKNGVRYHHIFDPATGQPARRLLSCTIISPSPTQADALSTAVFVLGPKEGMDLVERLAGAEAIMVTPEGEVLVSRGLKTSGKIQLLPW